MNPLESKVTGLIFFKAAEAIDYVPIKKVDLLIAEMKVKCSIEQPEKNMKSHWLRLEVMFNLPFNNPLTKPRVL